MFFGVPQTGSKDFLDQKSPPGKGWGEISWRPEVSRIWFPALHMHSHILSDTIIVKGFYYYYF